MSDMLKNIFEYIEDECKKFDLSLDTPSHKIEEYYVSLTGQDDDNEKTIQEKRDYLYNYLLEDMEINNEISVRDKNLYYGYISVVMKEKPLDDGVEIIGFGIDEEKRSVALVKKTYSKNNNYIIAKDYKIKDTGIVWEDYEEYKDLSKAIKDYDIVLLADMLSSKDKETEIVSESSEMSSLGIYHKMNKKYKSMLEDFIIYRDIEACAAEKGTKLKNYEVMELKDIILKFYEEDSIVNFPLNHTTKFIANNYIEGNISIRELKAKFYSEIYNAIEDDNIELLRIDGFRDNRKNKYKDMER